MSRCSGALEILVGEGLPQDLMSTVKFEGLVSSATERVLVERPRVVSFLNVLRSSLLDDDYTLSTLAIGLGLRLIRTI